MNSKARIFSLCVVGAALVASGCNSGGQASTVDPLPTSDTGTLTLMGVVTDDPIVNASVEFTVGSRSFLGAVPTGSAGEFQLDIQSDDPTALVMGSAHDAVNGIRLTAVLDTFAGCVGLARNNVVDNVKVTNISTAQQVIAERLALDGQIDSYDEYVDLLGQIDATELLDLSSAIKTVVENINGTVLPAGYTDTLALARQIADGSSTFVADLETLSPGAMDVARDRLLSDGNATGIFAATDAAGVYASVRDDLIYAVFDNGSALVEHFDDNPVPGTPSWNITDSGKLRINYFGFDRESDSLTLMGGAAGVMHLVTDTADLSGMPGSRVASTMTKYRFGAQFDAASLAGTYADPQSPQRDLVLQASGTGYSVVRADGSGQLDFTWSVTAQGGLMISYTNSARSVEFMKLNADSADRVLSIARYDGQWPTLSVANLTRS